MSPDDASLRRRGKRHRPARHSVRTVELADLCNGQISRYPSWAMRSAGSAVKQWPLESRVTADYPPGTTAYTASIT